MSNDRRSQIVAAARELLVARGRDALSVRNVAAAAGIGASTLRHYFPTQDDLHQALAVDHLHAEVSDLRIAEATVPPAERLEECLWQFLPASADEVPQLVGWITAYAAALGLEPQPGARQILDTLVAEGQRRAVTWLSVLADEGALRADGGGADGDVDATARMLMAAVDGIALSLLQGAATVEEARAMLRRIIAGLVVRDVGTCHQYGEGER